MAGKERQKVCTGRRCRMMQGMMFPNRETVERVRSLYPKGCRVVLEEMDDVQAPPIGTKGTVIGVDDTGSVMVRWDNGSGLHVVYGVDRCRRLEGEDADEERSQ
jgi:hypothetical protein